MPREVLKNFELATCNMSVPVMVALLGRIHHSLQETDELEDAAEHVREALALLFEMHERHFVGESGRPN